MEVRAAVFGAWLLWGCSSDGYRVVVHVPGGSSRARRVEVSVLRSCAELALLGDAPQAPLRQVEALDGAAPPLGKVPGGTYGLYGRAWDGDCALFAAACDTFAVEENGGGTVQITLSSIAPRGCAPDENCRGARCVAGDAGSSADAGPDASVDASLPDASVDASLPDAALPDGAPPDAQVPDAMPPELDAGRDAGLPSCDGIYADLPDYVLCDEDTETCEFFVRLGDGDSCADLCASVGQSCLDAFATDGPGDECSVRDRIECEDSDVSHLICVCTRR